jgi:hypothetical protein
MPVICRFFGIVVFMYWRDHPPAHFHAKYQGDEATIEIETGLVTGKLNPRALRMVQEWRELHTTELLENWSLATTDRNTRRIAPLE